jgi:SAM-dependent methyltransferase
MSELRKLFDRYDCDKGSKHSYERCYEQFFEPLKDKKINILEVGIYKGRSLQVLKDYFPNAQIYGIDIFTRVMPDEISLKNIFSNKNVHWAKCDSTECAPDFGDVKFDIIIDDGLHQPEANAQTLKNLWSLLKPDGSYFVEDVWPWDMMKFEEKTNNQWLASKNDIYNDSKYNMFLKQLENKHVERFDLRVPSTGVGHRFKNGDSYIFKVTNYDM